MRLRCALPEAKEGETMLRIIGSAALAALLFAGTSNVAFAHEDEHEAVHEDLEYQHQQQHQDGRWRHRQFHEEKRNEHELLHQYVPSWSWEHYRWHRQNAREHSRLHRREERRHR